MANHWYPQESWPSTFHRKLIYELLWKKKWTLDTWKIWFFNCTFRFLEHFCAINDYLEFDRNFKNKYHRELRVKKEKTSTSVASFSDISLKIEKKKIKTRLYDKRDAFPPAIVCMPHLDSNILSNVYYAYKFCHNYFGYGYLCNTFHLSFKENAETRKKT